MDYEQLVNAKEGEQVTLCVNFTGFPEPTITWTFKGIEIHGDYATELGADGSLMFFSVESKHAGKYVNIHSLFTLLLFILVQLA